MSCDVLDVLLTANMSILNLAVSDSSFLLHDMEHRLILHGKHRNSTFIQVELDRAYCSWVLGSTSLPLSLRLFQFYLRQRHGGIFTVGKYRGRFFDEVMQSDPSYSSWVMDINDACGNFLEYQRFISSMNTLAANVEVRPESRIWCMSNISYSF